LKKGSRYIQPIFPFGFNLSQKVATEKALTEQISVIEGPQQLVRDKMKDDILQKYDIPILRIKTNESGEESKLCQKLIDILKLEH
jgi:hypothetical protein